MLLGTFAAKLSVQTFYRCVDMWLNKLKLLSHAQQEKIVIIHVSTGIGINVNLWYS